MRIRLPLTTVSAALQGLRSVGIASVTQLQLAEHGKPFPSQFHGQVLLAARESGFGIGSVTALHRALAEQEPGASERWGPHLRLRDQACQSCLGEQR